jgi:hypothetical protein
MRHHSTSIVGPDLDGPEMRECKCVDGPGPCGRFIKHTVRNDRQIEVCCGCGAETDVGPAWTGCIKASDLEPPKPPGFVEAPAQPSVGERHKPLNMPAGRSKMIEKAINADDGACSTGKFAESDEAEYWSLRTALATIAHENLNTIGLSDSEKVAAFKKLAIDALSAAIASRVKRAEREGKR